MVAAKYNHDPQATLNYALDWTTYLALGDTITSSTWTIHGPDFGAPPATTITITTQSFNTTTTVVWLAGGTATAGQIFMVTNHITTAGGRQDDRSIKITITEE